MAHYTFETIKYNPYTSVILYPGKSLHTTEFWTIVYLIRGELNMRINDTNYKMSPTSVAFIPSNVPHQQLEHSDDYVQRDIYVSNEKMHRLCSVLSKELYPLLMKGPIVFDALRINLENMELLLNSFPANSSEENDFLDSLHSCSVIFMLTILLQTTNEKPTPPAWLIDLEKELSSPKNMQKSINEIFSTVNYSHSYICKEFKKYYNCSAVSYLNKNKIVFSISLLTDKNLSITDIAYTLGFATQNAYIKSFKMHYGISPGAWRKDNLKNKSLKPTNIWGKYN